MKVFHRSRMLLGGMEFLSALRCIRALADQRAIRPSADFPIRYQKYGVTRKALVRGRHLGSDLQSVLELAAGDCYRLSGLDWYPDQVIDAGANTGLFALAASARWPRSRVQCFEPAPENIALIKRHLEMNDLLNRITLVPSAVGGSARRARFFLREANQGSFDSGMAFADSAEVNVLRLRDVCAELQPCRLLVKLDVEGAEFEILRDCFHHLPLGQVVFVAEVHGSRSRQDELLQEGRAAGLKGGFWERADQTAHLLLAGPDTPVGIGA